MRIATDSTSVSRDRLSEADLKISAGTLSVLLIASGVILFLVTEGMPDAAIRGPLQTGVLLMVAAALIVWLLGEWQPWLARWLAVAAIAGFIYGLARALGASVVITLLTLPVGIASVTIGLGGAAALAAAFTIALGLSPRFTGIGFDQAATTVAMALMWMMIGVVYLAQRPARQLAMWSTARFELAEDLLEQTRSHRAELAQARDDLARANRRLALSNERVAALRTLAEQAQKAKSAFVSRVSHELRTPLNMIIGLVDLLTETPEVYGAPLPYMLMEDLGIVQRNCGHLASMINDVLDLSQAEAGRLALHREQAYLADIVEEARTVVQPLMQKKQLAFASEMPENLPPVFCDRVRVRQVLLNLLSNAARFTDRGSIRVEIQTQEDRALVSVIDTGPGMSEEEAEGVFEPFCQGGGSTWRDKGGSGLGLSISKELIELHGGRIWFESALGEGTTFTFSLPVAPPMPHPARPGHQIIEEWVWVDRPSGPDIVEPAGRRRVVVCDETDSLRRPFSNAAPDGIDFEHMRDLDEAILAVSRLPAHAFIVNTASPERLPALVGRATREVHQAPVFGCSIPAPLAQALEAGAADFLVKPVTRGRLEEALQTLGRPLRTILVVDDDPDVLQLLQRMLAAIDPTLLAATASTGAQAIEQLRALQPDLVLLDVVLPDFSGWEVLRRMGENPELGSAPVFMLTAQDPTNQPLHTDSLLVSMDGGLSVSRVLGCSLGVSKYLLQPEPGPDLALG